ncbi:MAG TPA: AbrB/MazE/SpoVT family DNA-binding domain-containing protein [Thermoanaerobaculia bacterium]|nr:AbrB/MazE/SpoVT family DNA-binding domain-containing protein [Thermoanaerobaculia bacterium]
MSTTTLTSKGQITLPKDIRDRLALKKGDRFLVAIGRNGLLTLERDERAPIENAFGMLQHLAKRKPATIPEMRAAVRRRAKRKYRA